MSSHDWGWQQSRRNWAQTSKAGMGEWAAKEKEACWPPHITRTSQNCMRNEEAYLGRGRQIDRPLVKLSKALRMRTAVCHWYTRPVQSIVFSVCREGLSHWAACKYLSLQTSTSGRCLRFCARVRCSYGLTVEPDSLPGILISTFLFHSRVPFCEFFILGQHIHRAHYPQPSHIPRLSTGRRAKEQWPR